MEKPKCQHEFVLGRCKHCGFLSEEGREDLESETERSKDEKRKTKIED